MLLEKALRSFCANDIELNSVGNQALTVRRLLESGEAVSSRVMSAGVTVGLLTMCWVIRQL